VASVREEDLADTSFSKPARAELSDIQHRLDKLDDRMHNVEVALARGARFPAWAGGLLALALGQLGGQIYLNGQVTNKVEALPALKAQCDECDRKITQVREKQVEVLSRLGELEVKAREGTDDRWRKADDVRAMTELNRYLDERFKESDRRIKTQEDRSAERDRWWQQLWGSGVMKGHRP